MAVISLIDHDGLYPNIALMKLSAYHKARGDRVQLNMPLFPADRVYISKTFTFSPPVHFPGECVIGGSGYDLASRLDDDVEAMRPDYSLYGIDYSMGFTSRGCGRNCGFCIVEEKEGPWSAVGDIYSFWDPSHRFIHIFDNNILMDKDHFMRIAEQCMLHDLHVKIEQGVDIRLVDDDICRVLASLRYNKLRISFDSSTYEGLFVEKCHELIRYVAPGNIQCFVLAGYKSDIRDAYYRFNLVKQFGFYPFVMVYDKLRTDPAYALFRLWGNSRDHYHIDFADFAVRRRMGYILDRALG